MSDSPQAPQSRVVRNTIAALFSHLSLIVGVFAACIFLVILFTIFSPRKYRSEAQFLVRNARGSSVISSERSQVNTIPDVSEEQINSELQVLESDDVLSTVADPGWNPAKAGSATPAELKAHDQKLTQLRGRLTVAPVRKSNVIEATVLEKTPRQATDTMSRLASAYLAAHERLARPQGSTAFFQDQAARYEQQWRDAINKLTVFQTEHGVVSVSDTEDKLNQRIAALQDEHLQAAAQLADLDKQIGGDERAINSLSRRNETSVRTLPNQTSAEQMRTQLLQLQNRRTEMLTRYKPSDRLVLEVEEEIASTTKALENAQSRSAQETTTDINPNWQNMQAALLHDQVARGGLVGKDAQIRDDTAKLQSQLSGATGLALQNSTLQENVQQAKLNYETFSQKYNQEQIEDAMDGRRLSNVAIAEQPTSSFRSSSPRPLLDLALGFLSAIFLSGGLLYLLESSRTTFGTPAELEAASRFRVLATVPLLSAAFRRVSSHPSGAERVTEKERSAAPSPELAMAGTMQSTRHPASS